MITPRQLPLKLATLWLTNPFARAWLCAKSPQLRIVTGHDFEPARINPARAALHCKNFTNLLMSAHHRSAVTSGGSSSSRPSSTARSAASRKWQWRCYTSWPQQLVLALSTFLEPVHTCNMVKHFVCGTMSCQGRTSPAWSRSASSASSSLMRHRARTRQGSFFARCGPHERAARPWPTRAQRPVSLRALWQGSRSIDASASTQPRQMRRYLRWAQGTGVVEGDDVARWGGIIGTASGARAEWKPGARPRSKHRQREEALMS